MIGNLVLQNETAYERLTVVVSHIAVFSGLSTLMWFQCNFDFGRIVVEVVLRSRKRCRSLKYIVGGLAARIYIAFNGPVSCAVF